MSAPALEAPSTDLRPHLEERARRWLADLQVSLSPAEFTALVDMCTPGLTSCEASAARRDVSPETIRTRRKRIYRLTATAGGDEVRAYVLHVALRELAGRMS